MLKSKPGSKPAGKPKPHPTGGGDQSIELDEPAPGYKGAAKAESGPPPVAGQMTEQTAQAKRLFDGEKGEDASLALYRVYKGETGADEGN